MGRKKEKKKKKKTKKLSIARAPKVNGAPQKSCCSFYLFSI
jgi:hypothetical protein